MQEDEIILLYNGCDEEADRQQFMQEVQAIETRHLIYFIHRPPMFEDESYGHLSYHFFFLFDSGWVILLLAESSSLPSEIIDEVQAAFRKMFDTPYA